jgi:alkylation response protein AidB-like acyl-CoA dehydrogenase
MLPVGSPIRPTGDPEALRPIVRAWLETNTPSDWHERLRAASPREFREFNVESARKLRDAGLLANHWPVEFGGGGFSFAEQLVIQAELVRADYPQPRLLEISLQHVAATLIAYGSDEQKGHLEGILDGEIWCQGFSEPEAGSDLAALRTVARREGDHYVVNGQKTWSSYADHATWCLLLARTDTSSLKHNGLSLFTVRLDQPGVEMRPIRQATGTEEFCEIFFTDVRLPVSSRVGEENAGWSMAQTTLATERVFSMLELHARLHGALLEIARQARRAADDGGTMFDDAALRQQIGQLSSEVDILGYLSEEVAADAATHGQIGPDGSIIKVYYSELMRRVTDLGAFVLGAASLIDRPRQFATSWTSGQWLLDHLKSWNFTIAAGTNEIQRNIIGERVLGLPREPRP